MNEFCAKKGIKREFSIARTPQQNEIAAKAMDDATRQAFEEEKKRAAQATSINKLNTVLPLVQILVAFVYLRGQIPIDASTLPNADLPIDPNMPDLEDDSNAFQICIFSDPMMMTKYVQGYFNNMDNTIDVSPIPTLRVHKDHPKGQILGDPKLAVQTIGKIQKASSVQQALKVWILVDLPFGKKEIGTKWVFKNKRDERSIVVKNKARLVAQGFRQEEGIDYDEVFAPVARIETIRLFLAFASFMGFPVCQMDVKSLFLYGTIGEVVYVHQPPGFVNPAYPNKVYKVIKALYGLHQAPRAWYETLSSFLLENGFRRGFQVTQKIHTKISKRIFQESITVGCQFLGRRLISWQCKKQTILANSTTEAEYVAAANCFLQIILDITTENNRKYLAPTLTKKIFGNMKKGFAGEHVPLLPAMLAGAAPYQGEGSAIPAGSQPTPDPGNEIPQSQGPTATPVADEATTTGVGVETEGATTTTSGLDAWMDIGNIHESPLRSHETPIPEGNTSGSVDDSLNLKELMDIAVLTLVERVKLLKAALKRKSMKVILSKSNDEETEDQGRKIQDIDDDPLVSLVRNSMEEKEADFVTPKKVSASGEAQEEEISPTTLEAAKTLSNVASQNVVHTRGEQGVNTGNTPVSTPSVIQTVNVIVPSPVKSQREEKAPMTSEDIQATQKTKEQIRQEEAGLAKDMRLQALQDKEDARQVHLDALLAKRIQEEQELSEQQQKRKAKVQEAAQFYTEEDWDTIKAKLEANAELTKEQKAKAKRDKPMTQAQQRDYMSTFIKNRSSWKMAQLKKLTFEELKVEFEKLTRSIKSFVPMGFEERVKRAGVQLEQESSKKQKIVVEDVSVTEEKVEVHEAEEDMEALVKGNDTNSSSGNDIPIIREDGTYITYINFRAMLKSILRDDLTELYRLVMQKYGTNGPEDEYERVFWGDLKTMFDPPLSTYPVWNLPYQQKMLRWRYYDTCRVHCLTLESADIYMLTKRRYPIPADVCQAMLDKKLQGDKKDEACYQLLKLIEKQAQNTLP
ncbi:putative ribonuclease H-like domain-containing protein [Tanacetum coccineum]